MTHHVSIEPGTLTERLLIEAPSVAVSTSGSRTTTWAPIARGSGVVGAEIHRARRRSLRRPRFAGQGRNRLRHPLVGVARAHPQHRFTWRGTVYSIVAVTESQPKVELILLATAGLNRGVNAWHSVKPRPFVSTACANSASAAASAPTWHWPRGPPGHRRGASVTRKAIRDRARATPATWPPPSSRSVRDTALTEEYVVSGPQRLRPRRQRRQGRHRPPGKDAFYARFVEFGTVHARPSPFIGPGFDASKEQAAQAIARRPQTAV